MSRARRLILVLTAGTFLVGALAVFTPATDARQCVIPCDAPCCDLDCRKNCPISKKVKGVGLCIFAGCPETTGECTYSCPQ